MPSRHQPDSVPPEDVPGAPDVRVRAACDLWPRLAAAAWRHTLVSGRGVLLLDENDLLDAAAEQRAGRTPPLTAGFVPATHVPRGDDFRPLVMQYDPAREILLLVQLADGDTVLLQLAADGHTRPTPEACARQEAPTPSPRPGRGLG